MKNKIRLYAISLIIVLTIALNSCKKDDDFIHVTPYEQALHNKVNEYRVSQGSNELVLQYVMVGEAQIHSKNWSESGDATAGLEDRVQTVKDKLGGTNSGVILSTAYNVPADSVVSSWENDSATSAILLDEYTQSGPGVYTDDAGTMFITHMFLNIPSK